jgi:hypothetical protein
LKLQYDEPLSKFAFKFNLRRYTEALLLQLRAMDAHKVGWCRLTLSNTR